MIVLDEIQRLSDAAQILKIAADDLVRRDSQRDLDLHDCRAPYARHLGSAAKGFCALANGCGGELHGLRAGFSIVLETEQKAGAKIPQLWASAHRSRVQF